MRQVNSYLIVHLSGGQDIERIKRPPLGRNAGQWCVFVGTRFHLSKETRNTLNEKAATMLWGLN